MELNKSPSPEKSDPAVATTNDEQCSSPTQAQAQARTYECNFCKRGFSNAQALGGHMNIHRKDKAKLKQTSPKAALSPATNLVIPTRSAFPERRDAVAANWTWINYNPENRDTTSIVRSDQGYVGEPRQLPLFNEATTLRVDDQDQKHSYDKESSSSSGHGADHDEDHDELDLELRLGHDPSLGSSSSTAKSTRKFF